MLGCYAGSIISIALLMLLTIKLGLLNAIVPRAVIAAVWPLPRPTLVPAGLGSSLRNRLRKKQSAGRLPVEGPEQARCRQR